MVTQVQVNQFYLVEQTAIFEAVKRRETPDEMSRNAKHLKCTYGLWVFLTVAKFLSRKSALRSGLIIWLLCAVLWPFKHCIIGSFGANFEIGPSKPGDWILIGMATNAASREVLEVEARQRLNNITWSQQCSTQKSNSISVSLEINYAVSVLCPKAAATNHTQTKESVFTNFPVMRCPRLESRDFAVRKVHSYFYGLAANLSYLSYKPNSR